MKVRTWRFEFFSFEWTNGLEIDRSVIENEMKGLDSMEFVLITIAELFD